MLKKKREWLPTWGDIMVNPTDRNDSLREIIIILIKHHSLDALVYLSEKNLRYNYDHKTLYSVLEAPQPCLICFCI